MKALPVLILSASTAFASTSRAQSAHFIGETLIIQDGARKIRLAEVIEPYPEYRVVHAVRKKAGEYFVVIGVSEWSRGYPPRDGFCGAGIESHIDWLRVSGGTIVERQSGLYESCFKNRDDWSIRWKDGVLHWRAQGFRHLDETGGSGAVTVHFSWKFDPAHPERGIEEHAVDGDPLK